MWEEEVRRKKKGLRDEREDAERGKNIEGGGGRMVGGEEEKRGGREQKEDRSGRIEGGGER